MMSRAGMFRVPHGVALDLNNRVFNLPSFNGTVVLFSSRNNILLQSIIYHLVVCWSEFLIVFVCKN